MNTGKRMNLTKVAVICAVVLLLVLPLIGGDPYSYHILIMIGAGTILAWGVRLVLITGHLTVAHAAFAAIGAYTSTLLVMRLGISFWGALPISGVVAALFGLLLGYISLRIKGIYFVILTLCFAEVVRVIIGYWPFLGGYKGILGIPAPDPIAIPILGVIDFRSKIAYYYLVLLVALLTGFVMHRIDASRLGRIFRSIEESEGLAESIGINCLGYKVLAFVIACFFAGVTGSLLAHYRFMISPEFFTVWDSIYFLLYVVIGGTGSVAGPVVGAVILVALPEFLHGVALYKDIIFAGVLLAVVFGLPQGLISLPGLIGPKLLRRTKLGG